MSAFIVQDQCINRIVDFCYRLGFERQGPLCYLRPPRVLDASELPDFARELFMMNVAAVAQRYGDADTMMPDQPFDYRPARCDNLHQVVKSLDCFLYQCTEGDVDKRPLYVALSDLRDSLCRVMITSSPQYDAAEWG